MGVRFGQDGDALLGDDSPRGLYLGPAGVRAGVHGLGWHSFRHTYRANVRDIAKAPLEIQSQMLRHSTLEMTTKYGRKSEDKKKPMRKAHLKVEKKVAGTEDDGEDHRAA